jgi:hypothetical protein
MTGKPMKHWVFHQIKLMSLGIKWMSIENHQIICGKRSKNVSQPITSPFTRRNHHKAMVFFYIYFELENGH